MAVNVQLQHQWFIYNFIPIRPRTRLGYMKWVLLENHCVHYRIFHYNFVSPGTRWDLKRESQSKKCEYGTRDAQVKESLQHVWKPPRSSKSCYQFSLRATLPLFQDTRSNELLVRLGFEDLDLILKERRLRWYEHVERSNGAVKTAFDIQVDGKHGPGRPKMTWKQLTEGDCSGSSQLSTLMIWC